MQKQKRVTRGSPSGRLRIVAGKWRSRLLPVAAGDGLRPTAERIRETLFNWLAPFVHGADCLDLFAGSGALGLEALSRGAATVLFVEKSRTAAAQLRSSIKTLDADGATVLETDARRWLQQRSDKRFNDRPGGRFEDRQKFDIVFVDPPFADGGHDELCRLLAERQCLKSGAHIYLEQDREQSLPSLPPGWELLKDKTAGNVRYSLARAATFAT